MEVLTPGEKIKKLRVDIGLKQEDITNGEVSKSLVSMIERNKRGLTWSVASSIADCLNKYYKNMGKEITPEFLMETEVDCVTKEIHEDLAFLKEQVALKNCDLKLTSQAIDKIMGLVNQWNLHKEKMELLLIRGDFFYYSYQYNCAIRDYSDVLIYYVEEKRYDDMAKVYNYIGSCYHMLMMIDQAINNYSKAYDITVEHNILNKEKIRMQASLNLIICYRKIQKYDMALQNINKLKETQWKNNQFYNKYYGQLFLLEANTYRELNNNERAEKLYNKLIQMQDELSVNTLFLAYENYAICCIKYNEIEKALDNVEKAFNLIEQVNPNESLWIYLTKSKCYLESDRYDKALDTLNEGIVLARELNNNEMVINFRFTLAETYILLKDYDNALNHLRDAEKFIIKSNINAKENDLNILLGEVYCLAGEVEKGVEYMTKARKSYLSINHYYI